MEMIRTFQLCLRLDRAAKLLRLELDRFGFAVSETPDPGWELPPLVERRHDRVRRLYVRDKRSLPSPDGVLAPTRQVVLSQVYGGLTTVTVLAAAHNGCDTDTTPRAQDMRILKAILATGMSAFAREDTRSRHAAIH
ncbi:MAG: hypothetical protein AB1772_06735 [Candidatus Zixiibacteriota bacterium]